MCVTVVMVVGIMAHAQALLAGECPTLTTAAGALKKAVLANLSELSY
jgi:hypothetical protein